MVRPPDSVELLRKCLFLCSFGLFNLGLEFLDFQKPGEQLLILMMFGNLAQLLEHPRVEAFFAAGPPRETSLPDAEHEFPEFAVAIDATLLRRKDLICPRR